MPEPDLSNGTMVVFTKRPYGGHRRLTRSMWDGARMVFGEPPEKLTMVKAHCGQTTKWIIIKGEQRIEIHGPAKTAYAKLMEMV